MYVSRLATLCSLFPSQLIRMALSRMLSMDVHASSEGDNLADFIDNNVSSIAPKEFITVKSCYQLLKSSSRMLNATLV